MSELSGKRDHPTGNGQGSAMKGTAGPGRWSFSGPRAPWTAPLADLGPVTDAAVTPLDRVIAIRRHLYQTVPWSTSALARELSSVLAYPMLAQVFAEGDVGVQSGGMALLFTRALQAYGFAASTYDFGVAGVASHVVTLVDVDGRLLLQDAYLNYGIEVDFTDLLERLEAGERTPPIVDTRDYKPFLFTDDTPDKATEGWAFSAGLDQGAAGPGLRKVLVPGFAVWSRQTKAFAAQCAAFLRECEKEEDGQFLLLNPIGALNEDNAYATDPNAMGALRAWRRRGGSTLAEKLAEKNQQEVDPVAALAPFTAEMALSTVLQKELRALRSELGVLERNAARDTRALRSILENLQQDVTARDQRITGAEHQAARAEHAMLEAQNRLRAEAAEREALQAEAQTVRAELDMAQAALQKLALAEAERAASLAIADRLQSELKAAKQALQASDAAAQAAQAAFLGFAEEFETMRENFLATEAQWQTQAAQWQEERAASLAAADRTQSELKAAEQAQLADAARADREAKNAKEEVRRLEIVLAEARAALEVSELGLDNARRQLAGSRYLKMRRKIAALFGVEGQSTGSSP